ncbi:MAG TPA: hypothetical protein VH394_05245 [Thermoanaerobaculia bacterium]|jgi:hypothetical protein|nr:hypothetical protein [Thermoanaerobaculia bacterium]
MRRSLLALAFSGFLSVSWLSHPTFLDPLWGLLRSWSKPALEAGCIMDPDGSCRPAAPQADEGCIMDPDGKCRPGS